jgi:hypothetical protein
LLRIATLQRASRFPSCAHSTPAWFLASLWGSWERAVMAWPPALQYVARGFGANRRSFGVGIKPCLCLCLGPCRCDVPGQRESLSPFPSLVSSTTALHYSTAALSTPTKQPACPPLLAQTSAKCQCDGSSRWTCSLCGRRSGRSSTGATTEFREPIARTVRAVPVPEGHWIRLIVGLPDQPLKLSSHCPKS